MGFCTIQISSKALKIIGNIQAAILTISLISSILLIILVIREIRRKYRRENVLGMDLSKYIICIGIYDLLFELIIISQYFYSPKNQSQGPLCKTTEVNIFFFRLKENPIFFHFSQLIVMVGVMGEYITTPAISLYFWGMLTGKLNVRFSIYLLISIPFCFLMGYLIGW